MFAHLKHSIQTWTNSLLAVRLISTLLQKTRVGPRSAVITRLFYVVWRVWHCVYAGCCCRALSAVTHMRAQCANTVCIQGEITFVAWNEVTDWSDGDDDDHYWKRRQTATSRIIETRNKCAFYNNKSLFSNLKIKKEYRPIIVSDFGRCVGIARFFHCGFGYDYAIVKLVILFNAMWHFN